MRRPLLLFILTFAIYLFIAVVILAPDGIWSPDEGLKLWQLRSLRWENGRFAYDLLYAGRDIDPDFHFLAPTTEVRLFTERDNQLFLQRLPSFSLLVWPFYALFGLVGIYIVPALAGAASTVLPLLFLPTSERRWPMWGIIAFGSPVFIYSTLYWEHTAAVALALAGAFVAYRLFNMQQSGSAGHQLWGWLGAISLFALATFIRLETIIFAAGWLTAVWLLSSQHARRWLFFVGVGLVLLFLLQGPLLSLFFENRYLPDNAWDIFRPGHYLQYAGITAVRDLLIGPTESRAVDSGSLGWIWAISSLLAVLFAFLPAAPWQKWGVTLSLAVTTVVALNFLLTGEPYRSAHGLLFTTPWLVVTAVRWAEMRRTNPPESIRLIALASFLGLLIYAIAVVGVRSNSPQGGLEWGTRLAMASFPLLGLLIFYRFKIDYENWTHLFSLLLLILGVLFQLRGYIAIYADKQRVQAMNTAINSATREPVVVDQLWGIYRTAPVHNPKQVLILTEPGRAFRLIEQLQQNGIERFSLTTRNPQLLSDMNKELTQHRLTAVQQKQIGELAVYELSIETR